MVLNYGAACCANRSGKKSGLTLHLFRAKEERSRPVGNVVAKSYPPGYELGVALY